MPLLKGLPTFLASLCVLTPISLLSSFPFVWTFARSIFPMRIFYSRLFRTGKEFEKFEYSIIRHSREHSSSLKYLGFSRWKIVSKFEFTRRERIFFFFYYYLIFYIEAEGRKGSNGLNLYLALKYITLRRKFTSLARTIKDITKADIML